MGFIGMVFVAVIILAFIIAPIIFIVFKGTFFALGTAIFKLIPDKSPDESRSPNKMLTIVGYVFLGIVVFSFAAATLRSIAIPLGVLLLLLMTSKTVTDRLNRYAVIAVRVVGAVILTAGVIYHLSPDLVLLNDILNTIASL